MSEGIKKIKRSAIFVDLGFMEYSRALDLQIEAVSLKTEKRNLPDIVFFVEHPWVFTLGKQGGRENLTVSEQFLKQKDIKVIQTGRGGNITCHGPGQAVMYPVVDLEKNRIGVKDFVFGLEEIMKLAARDFGVMADRDARNHGIWVENCKIGSVGLCIKKGISFHGIAMNINPDPGPFSWINPCGLSNITMTSLENEMKKTGLNLPCPSVQAVKKHFIGHFTSIFDYEIIQALNENEFKEFLQTEKRQA